MKVPQTFVPDKNLEKKTKELLRGKSKLKKITPLRIICKDLTLEELARSDVIENYLICVTIGFKHYDCGYALSFFPNNFKYRQLENRSLIQLTQTEGLSHTNIEDVSFGIAEYYNTKRGAIFQGFNNNKVVNMFPNISKLNISEIIYDLNDFFVTNFEDVRILSVKYEDVTYEEFGAAQIPKSKIGLLCPM